MSRYYIGHHRRRWQYCMGIMYPPSGSLHHHVDGHGWWVCLFNLGNDSSFHCGTGAMPRHRRLAQGFQTFFAPNYLRGVPVRI